MRESRKVQLSVERLEDRICLSKLSVPSMLAPAVSNVSAFVSASQREMTSPQKMEETEDPHETPGRDNNSKDSEQNPQQMPHMVRSPATDPMLGALDMALHDMALGAGMSVGGFMNEGEDLFSILKTRKPGHGSSGGHQGVQIAMRSLDLSPPHGHVPQAASKFLVTMPMGHSSSSAMKDGGWPTSPGDDRENSDEMETSEGSEMEGDLEPKLDPELEPSLTPDSEPASKARSGGYPRGPVAFSMKPSKTAINGIMNSPEREDVRIIVRTPANTARRPLPEASAPMSIAQRVWGFFAQFISSW